MNGHYMEPESRTDKKEAQTASRPVCHVADLPPGCLEKIHDFERELNRQGCWNIALVAYQLNG